jgi:hypothetical protein
MEQIMSKVTIVMEEEEYKKYLSQKEQITSLTTSTDLLIEQVRQANKTMAEKEEAMHNRITFANNTSDKHMRENKQIAASRRDLQNKLDAIIAEKAGIKNLTRWQHFKIAIGWPPK